MIKHLKALVLAFIVSLAPLTQLAMAEDDGKELAFRYKCMTCHGVKGISAESEFPHLAGQSKLYLVTRLQYFASRQEPYSPMLPHALPLSEEEMEKLAEYFSSVAR